MCQRAKRRILRKIDRLRRHVHLQPVSPSANLTSLDLSCQMCFFASTQPDCRAED